MDTRMLKDDQIIGAIIAGKLGIAPFDHLTDPYNKRSPVQPASLDLTIGKIAIPPEVPGGDVTVLDGPGHVLRAGETVVVETRENVSLSSEIAGFGFPPAEVSTKGILMTNPGHIDPGFSGRLKFTLINMGRADFSLVHKGPIATVLLFELSGPATKDYKQRRPVQGASSSSIEDVAKVLARDFVEFRSSARAVAKEEIRLADRKAGFWRPLIAGVAVLGAAAITAVVTLSGKIDRTELLPLQEGLHLLELGKVSSEQFQSLKLTVKDLARQKSVDANLTEVRSEMGRLVIEFAKLRAETAASFEPRLRTLEKHHTR